ncbi:MAG TPA: endonuclease/exonuclease/phosphatase family protein [Planctomycetota bacterium]|nr:endonuclease/exonuclease/phosphatase family protein [Planctomycetota bacterium]
MLVGTLRAKTSFCRTTQIATAWIAAALAWCTALLALVGPHLGGSAPGLEGLPGFLIEIATAMWVHVGELSAIVAVAALVRRLRWPAAALGVIALVALLPEWWPHPAPLALTEEEGTALRVAAVNLCAESGDVQAMEASLRQLDADVLVMPEFTTTWAERLERWFANDYPHRWLGAPSARHGYAEEGARIAVWSRIPGAGDFEIRQAHGCQVRVSLRFRERTFALYAIHAWPPVPYRQYNGVQRERQLLLDWIRGESLPTIVAGDCNASPKSPFLLRLRECGLTVAAEEVLGSAPVTWPMFPSVQAPLRIAIDHVLHSSAFRAVGFRRGIANGSDHAPVLAELAWRG